MNHVEAITDTQFARRCVWGLLVLMTLLVTGCPPRDHGPVTPPGNEKEPVTYEEGDPLYDPTLADCKNMVAEDFYDEEATVPKLMQQFLDCPDGRKLLHGVVRAYWEDGSKRHEVPYVNGIKHGMRRAWYRNGAVWSEGVYDRGREDGLWITWYPDGTVEQEIHMVKGAWHGTYTTYHPNGNKMREVEYDHGRAVGLMTIWDENGEVLQQFEAAAEGPHMGQGDEGP